jgi:hypothetical protein
VWIEVGEERSRVRAKDEERSARIMRSYKVTYYISTTTDSRLQGESTHEDRLEGNRF